MRYKTVETQPDSSTNTVYANKYGQVMSRLARRRWQHQPLEHVLQIRRVDRALVQKVMPSAMSLGSGDNLELTDGGTTFYSSNDTGLVYNFNYGDGGNGPGGDQWPTNFGYDVGMSQGIDNGTPIFKHYQEYDDFTYDGITIYKIVKEADLPTGAMATGGDRARTIEYGIELHPLPTRQRRDHHAGD